MRDPTLGPSDYSQQSSSYPQENSGIAKESSEGLQLGNAIITSKVQYTENAQYQARFFFADRVILSIRDEDGKTHKVSVLTSEIARKLGISDAQVRSLVENGDLEARITAKLGLKERHMEKKPLPRTTSINLNQPRGGLSPPSNTNLDQNESLSPPSGEFSKKELQSNESSTKSKESSASDSAVAASSTEQRLDSSSTSSSSAIAASSSTSTEQDILSKLDQFGLSESEFNTIQSWYQEKKDALESQGQNVHFKAATTKLPRTVIYIAGGPHKGLHIKTKISVGMGSFNRASKALHVETGRSKIVRSGKADEVPESEREGNTRYAAIDPDGQHFATGAVVLHKGNWRSRQDMKQNQRMGYSEKTIKQEKDVEKVTLIMDELPGGELYNLIIRSPPLTMHEKLTILCRLNQALVLAHKNGLVNIDYKPENVFMLDLTNPRIGDFGMVFTKGDTLSKAMGSPGYVAPEVLLANFSSQTIHPGTEMWIHGVMMSIMLKGAGFFNWTGQPDFSDMGKILNSSKLENGVDQYFQKKEDKGSIDWCIAQCLQYKPENRISAEQLQKHLDNLLTQYAPKQTETT